jgi:hypothetical protein
MKKGEEMSEELTTQEAVAESTEVPEAATGLSEPKELSEEYKPYSMIPWDQIPEEQRPAVLDGVKKFHGGMTRGQQDTAKLRSQVVELTRKAELLDQLVAEPWVREAWEAHQKGQSVAKQPEPTVNLTEHLDQEAAKAIEQIIEKKLSERIGPLNSQLTNLNQEQANARAKMELADLVKKAGEKGWPDPYERLDVMAQVVAAGRAKTVEDAYRLATYDDVPDLVKEKTRKTLTEELQSKASKTVAATMGGAKNGAVATYSGRDAVLNAFRDTKRELGL